MIAMWWGYPLQTVKLVIPRCPPLLMGGCEKIEHMVQMERTGDWRSFRAQPLEIEALCRKLG